MKKETVPQTVEKVDGRKRTQFTSENQPSPEAKKRGWQRYREKRIVLDLMRKLIIESSVGDLERLKESVKSNPDQHTVLEAKMAQYAGKEKFMIDFLDRVLGKPSQSVNAKVENVTVDDFIERLSDPNKPYDER